MSGNPEDHPMVRNERKQRAKATGEPLYSPELSVYRSGNGLVIGVPSVASDILGINAGDDRTVEIHQTGIWIPCDTDE
jgi:hypothetical protein